MPTKACAWPDCPLPLQDRKFRDQVGKGVDPQLQEVCHPQPRAGHVIHTADRRCWGTALPRTSHRMGTKQQCGDFYRQIWSKLAKSDPLWLFQFQSGNFLAKFESKKENHIFLLYLALKSIPALSLLVLAEFHPTLNSFLVCVALGAVYIPR